MLSCVRDRLLNGLDTRQGGLNDYQVSPQLQRPTEELRQLLRSSLAQHSSAAIFIYGAAGAGREQVIHSAIGTVFSSKVRLAQVSGSMSSQSHTISSGNRSSMANIGQSSDELAILSIARQLNIRSDVDKSFSDAMNDLSAQLRVRESPSVICFRTTE